MVMANSIIRFLNIILASRFGNKPIDDKVLTWTSGSIPENWTQIRDKWFFLHKLRTIVELAALAPISWAGIKKD